MKFIFAALILIQLGIGVSAQSLNAQVTAKPRSLDAQLKTATQESKNASTELLNLQQDAVKKASDSLAQLRQLYSEGLIARVELEKGEQELAAATDNVDQTRAQIANTERVTAEIQKAAELAKFKPLVKPTLMSRNNLILRSTSSVVSASLSANLSNVQQFFQSTFNRVLPTSAIGQSGTHDKMGWDHRNSFDIGVHPDSAEGQALISYLKTAGIPFLAFRSAIPGVATGPHIHVGNPSHRLS